MNPQIQPRKRMRRLELEGHARFLTFSCNHRLPLFGNDRIKQVFAERLTVLQSEKPFELFAWVVMPEHMHILLRPNLPRCNVSELMRALKRPVAERVLRRWKQLKAPVLSQITDGTGLHFWQTGGGYDRNIYSQSELTEKIDYIHDNPVRRGLVASALDWTYSSAKWYAGFREGAVPISPVPI